MSFAKHESCVGFSDPVLSSHALAVPWRGTRHSSSVKTQQLFYLKFDFKKPNGVLQMGMLVDRSEIPSSHEKGIHEQDTEWSDVHFKVTHS